MTEARLLARVERKRAQLALLRPLPAEARWIGGQLQVEWIHISNAIAGSTLTLAETRTILETGLTVGGHSLREHLEVVNGRAAIAFIEELAVEREPLTPLDVRQIHRLLLTRIDDGNAGHYRTSAARGASSDPQPPDAGQLPALVRDWAEWLGGPSAGLHPIARAALAHQRLLSLQPFLEASGQTARLVMNLLLLREGYPPAIALRANRAQLEHASSEACRGRAEPLVSLVARAVERSLTLLLEASAPAQGSTIPAAEWVPLREASQGTRYGLEYLSLLARTGRLEALKRGKTWFTTRQAVRAYQDSLQRRG